MPVVVRNAGDNVFTMNVSAGRHKLFADEPVGSGGANTGLSPYDLLLASLGSCTR